MKGHAQKETFLGLLRVWYADENALVRQKLHAARIKRITPWLSEIIRQGLEEGIVTTGYPDQVIRQAFVEIFKQYGGERGAKKAQEVLDRARLI